VQGERILAEDAEASFEHEARQGAPELRVRARLRPPEVEHADVLYGPHPLPARERQGMLPHDLEEDQIVSVETTG